MKALSVRQPYATLICTPREDNPLLGIKDIENRTTRTHFRGRIYIHASMQWHDRLKTGSIYTKEQVYDILNNAKGVFEYRKYCTPEFREPLPIGAIIGEVYIIDCVQDHPSIWAEKSMKKPHIDDFTLLDNGIEHTDETSYYHALNVFNNQKPIWNWVLANPVIYEKPILNVKGKLSFWEFTPELCEHLNIDRSDGLDECLDCGIRNY